MRIHRGVAAVRHASDPRRPSAERTAVDSSAIDDVLGDRRRVPHVRRSAASVPRGAASEVPNAISFELRPAHDADRLVCVSPSKRRRAAVVQAAMASEIAPMVAPGIHSGGARSLWIRTVAGFAAIPARSAIRPVLDGAWRRRQTLRHIRAWCSVSPVSRVPNIALCCSLFAVRVGSGRVSRSQDRSDDIRCLIGRLLGAESGVSVLGGFACSGSNIARRPGRRLEVVVPVDRASRNASLDGYGKPPVRSDRVGFGTERRWCGDRILMSAAVVPELG